MSKTVRQANPCKTVVFLSNVICFAITPALLVANQDGEANPAISKQRDDQHGIKVQQEPLQEKSEQQQKMGQRDSRQELPTDNEPLAATNSERKSSEETKENPIQKNASQQPLKLQKDSMVQVEFGKRTYWGRPLAWNGKQMAVVGLDGQLNLLPVASKSDFKLSPEKFQPYSPELLRSRLEKEFGKRHQVTTTANFVVVHPYGDRQIWAPPFEVLYDRFREYFEGHGFVLEEPEFPLVAIVLRSRSEFDRYMDKNSKYNRNVRGIYTIDTNRMVTYDPKAMLRTAKKDKEWLFKYKTVIHELAHQAAFNSGVHNRFSPPPRWAGEGLAMMFETRGVNNSKVYTKRGDRVNRSRLKALKQYYAKGKIDGKLERMITDDRLFQTEPFVANELAWGLTFYLSEKFPKRYFEYLKKDGDRKNFQAYLPRQRRAEFTHSFGPDLTQIEADLRAFINKF